MTYLVDLWKAEWCIKTQLVRSAASRLGSKSIPMSGSEAKTMPACQSCLVLSVGLSQCVRPKVVISCSYKWEPPQGKCSRHYETWKSLHVAINILHEKCWSNQTCLPFPSSGCSERKPQALWTTFAGWQLQGTGLRKWVRLVLLCTGWISLHVINISNSDFWSLLTFVVTTP